MKRFITKGLLGVLVFALTVSLTTSLAHSKGTFFQGHEYREGEFLVKFKPNTASNKISTVTSALGAQVLLSPASVKKGQPIVPNLYLLKADKIKVTQALSLLSASPEVEYAEPNYKLYPLNFPNDPSFYDQWNLYNSGLNAGTPGADIRGPWGWHYQTGSRSVVVAVVDTGVDYYHPDLAGNMWINQAEIPGNGLDDDNDGYVDDVHGIDVVNYFIDPSEMAGAGDPMDNIGHGTLVAGVIGACGNNNIGIAGVNWKVSIMATKFFDNTGAGGTINDVILCLQYIRDKKRAGVNIIAANNSWGGGGYSRALYDAIRALQDEGVLFVAAAGNDGEDNDIYHAYPGSYDLMNVISVAATDRHDELVMGYPYFWASNYGKHTVDVGAPGESILSTCSPSLPLCWSTGSWPYYTESGTSLAAPHITGLAALLKAQDQTRDWKQIRNLILSTGNHLPSLENTTVTGMRINAERAMTSPSDARLFAVLSPADSMTSALYSPIDLEVHDILGANPKGPVTCTIGNTKVNLLDNGVFPDKVAGDGVFSARWTPPRVGDFSLEIESGYDHLKRTVAVNVTQLPPRYTINEIPHTYTDISTTGNHLYIGDDETRVLDLTNPTIADPPLTLTIYGESYSYLGVGDNGGVSVDTWVDCVNAPFPTGAGYGNLIAPFWDDLAPDSGSSDVFYRISGTYPNRTLTIQWNNMHHYNLGPDPDGVTFQAIFHEDNPDIEYRYADVSFGDPAYDSGSSATVGAQKDALDATQFSYNTPSLKNNLSLELTASQFTYPQLSVEPYYLDFYFVQKGKSRDLPVYVYNTGNNNLTVTDLTITGTNEYRVLTKLQWNPAILKPGKTLLPGESMQVMVRYTPNDDQSDYASLTVKTDGGMSAISIYGCGFVASDIDLQEKAIDFGELGVGYTYEEDLTIQNKGNADLRIDNIDVDAPFSIEGSHPPYTLTPGSSITLTIRFSPEEEGSFEYKMAIFSNDPDEPAVLVPLTGIGYTGW